MKPLRVLVGCESSGAVREAFRALGHDAWSCDILPADDGSPAHFQCDVFGPLQCQRWDLLIAFPPCTYVCGSGIHWNSRRPERAKLTEQAVRFFRDLLEADVPRIALENPVGILSNRIRKPDQIIQPYEFGDDASKKTCLWLKGLPPLQPTRRVPGRKIVHNGRTVERWSNQTDSGQNRLGPSDDRWKERSRTYNGIAQAMAQQWGCHPVI